MTPSQPEQTDEITRAEAVGDGSRTEDALLSLLGFRLCHGADGFWVDPEGQWVPGGRYAALEEACARVENGDVCVADEETCS